MLKLFSNISGVKGKFSIKINLVLNNLRKFCSLILNDAREVQYTTLFLPVVFRSLYLKSTVKFQNKTESRKYLRKISKQIDYIAVRGGGHLSLQCQGSTALP
jgi:hypothetical protein